MKRHTAILYAAVLLLALPGCRFDDYYCFVKPATAEVNTPVSFSSCYVNGASYQWDFGNGVTANGQNQTFTYTQVSTYQVTLLITRRLTTTKYSSSITITPPDTALSACFMKLNSRLVYGDTAYLWNCSKNADRYFWDFGDGTTDTAKDARYVITKNTRVTLTAYKGAQSDTEQIDLVLESGISGMLWKGTYSVVDSCTNGTFNYTANITAPPLSSATVMIDNLYNQGNSITLDVQNYFAFINSQPMGSYTVLGNAFIDSSFNTIEVNYDIFGGGLNHDCKAVFTRQ